MSALFNFEWFVGNDGPGVLVDAGLKATIVLLIAALTARLLERSSAAVRHRIWSLGLAGALLMPVLSLTVPPLRLPILPARTEQRTSDAHRPGSEPNIAANRPTSERGDEFHASPAMSGDWLFAPDNHEAPPAMAEGRRANPLPASISIPNAAITRERSASPGILDYLSLVWAVGLLVMLAPLLVGFVVNWRTLRRSEVLMADCWLRLITELSARIGLTRRVTAFESTQPIVPRPVDSFGQWCSFRRVGGSGPRNDVGASCCTSWPM